MKNNSLIRNAVLTVLMLACVLSGMLAIEALTGSENSFADTDYKYTVIVYSGRVDQFKNGARIWRKEFNYGERCEFGSDTLGLKLTDKRYYGRGFRITGHDNDETSGFTRLNFNVTEDVSYEMAYGIKGDMVAYEVHYVDQSGNEIHKKDIYYGMAGDKPVVAYRYIEGYEPETHNISKTLSKDESENIFVFKYTRVKTEGDEGDDDESAAPGTTDNPAGTESWVPGDDDEEDDDEDDDDDDDDEDGSGRGRGGNGSGNGQGGQNGQNGSSDQDGQDYTDIDENSVPAAIRRFAKKVAETINRPEVAAWLTGIIIFLILLFFILKRRKRDEDDESEDESEDGPEAGAEGESAVGPEGESGDEPEGEPEDGPEAGAEGESGDKSE